MKSNILNKLVTLIIFCTLAFNVNSQQVNTMYFMDNVPVRHYLNPAFQPLSDFYFGAPVLGYTHFDIGNNSLTLKDFVYNKNGQTISFLHQNGSVDKFYNAFKETTLIGLNTNVNLLNFGFRNGAAYWSFSLTEKVDANLSVPQDFMKLLLYGTPERYNNIYDLKTLGVNASAYTEAALGYSRNIDDKLSVGAKIKFLWGTANVKMINTDLTLNAGIDEWTLIGNGNANYSGPINLNGTTIQNFDPIMPSSASDFLKPAGLGGAVDLGATYKILDQLTVSAAVTDLGMIRWSQNASNIGYSVNYKFIGVDSITMDTDFDTDLIVDSIVDAFSDSERDSLTNSSYFSNTIPKVNIGVEYGFLDNKLSVGLLSRTMFQYKTIHEEITASVNARPIDWFNFSLSYSLMNGRFSNLGAGMGLRVGFVNLFVAADYIPLNYAGLKVSDSGSDYNIPIAYNSKGMNVAFGFNLVFGNRKDKDKDGVVDRKDKCPETPFGVIVDKIGCPVDADGDGVPDFLDKCDDTPLEAYNLIDQNGCPVDNDADGVPDYLDQCPDTPADALGFIDEKGCEKDTDNDGVFDYLDKCPDTPDSIKVDSVGCPLDTDFDGVPDYLDLCQDTPELSRGLVDKNGCPLDSDGDGVFDYLDLCPNTSAEALKFVDKNGCPLDSDDDGVADYLDKCPNTPKEARGMVDAKGCERDTDGDGVFDYLDNCPKVPGVATNKGCPEIKKEIRTLFQKALRGIQFESGKDLIRTQSFSILNDIAKVLVENPSYLIEVRGHTDNVGKADMNQELSEGRALSVKNYLIGKGVPEKRMTSHGFGDTLPITTNKTSAGRALNRRVEFIVTFEETTFE